MYILHLALKINEEVGLHLVLIADIQILGCTYLVQFPRITSLYRLANFTGNPGSQNKSLAVASIAREHPSTLPGDDPICIDPKHVVFYSTCTVTKALGRTSLEILRGRSYAGWNSGLGTSGACRSTATIQIDVEGVISYLSSICLLYTSPSPRDRQKSRMPSSA